MVQLPNNLSKEDKVLLAAMLNNETAKKENPDEIKIKEAVYGATATLMYEGFPRIEEIGISQETNPREGFESLQTNYRVLRYHPADRKLARPWTKNLFENRNETLWADIEAQEGNVDESTGKLTERYTWDGIFRAYDVTYDTDFYLLDNEGKKQKNADGTYRKTNRRIITCTENESIQNEIRRDAYRLAAQGAFVGSDATVEPGGSSPTPAEEADANKNKTTK